MNRQEPCSLLLDGTACLDLQKQTAFSHTLNLAAVSCFSPSTLAWWSQPVNVLQVSSTITQKKGAYSVPIIQSPCSRTNVGSDPNVFSGGQ